MPQHPIAPGTRFEPVPNFPGYWVGEDGSILSAWVRAGVGKGYRLRTDAVRTRLKPFTTLGYRRVNLHRGGRVLKRHVARLVLLAFVGEPPPGTQVCHNNGRRDDD